MFDPPDLGFAALARIVADGYGLDGSMTPLRGERDQNTLIRIGDHDEFVLKVASPSEGAAVRDHADLLLDVLDRQFASFELRGGSAGRRLSAEW